MDHVKYEMKFLGIKFFCNVLLVVFVCVTSSVFLNLLRDMIGISVDSQ